MSHTETDREFKHRQEAEKRLSIEGRKYFKYIEFDPDEELVSEVRKHPFGLFMIFLTGVLVILAVLAIGILGFVDLGQQTGISEANSIRPILIIASFFLIIGAAIATMIGAFLYVSNVIYVTSEKIAQVLYISLFNRKISQLSIGDVQDVTVTQKGILAHFFNYGTLIVETAGEQANYKFSYVPDPYQTSKIIVGAHEKNLSLHGN